MGNRDGSVSSFKRSDKGWNRFDFKVTPEFMMYPLGGVEHPLNTEIQYEKIPDEKDPERYTYKGRIVDGSGRVREFESDNHRWMSSVKWKEKKTGFLYWSETVWTVLPDTWTPFQIPITEERLPNGNILCYHYISGRKKERSYPQPKLLSGITAYNKDKTQILGAIEFSYIQNEKEEITDIIVTGSDRRSSYITHDNMMLLAKSL